MFDYQMLTFTLFENLKNEDSCLLIFENRKSDNLIVYQ
ncbi:hypothetical protein PORCRE_1629 [Porphyromonas crevioricanis JCM 15906]|uniref:Uncharacterized protein n=1 Tax=Porphyromonas crevioricanis JCM 15906 TaxID=1305617 RepID=T1DTN6_9PORP|nr:hypothetical protein PORCRE_1629 [Porphyromonas crevioricanis JCM 15906]